MKPPVRTAALAAAFLASRRERKASPYTIDWYRSMVEPFAAATPKNPRPDDVRAWISQAKAPTSVHTRLRALRAFARWAKAAKLVDSNFTKGVVAPPVRGRAKPQLRTFTVAELRRILAAAGDPRDRAAVTVLADTGIRIGELASLRAEDVELDVDGQGWLTVAGKVGARRIPASSESLRALQRIMPASGPVFLGTCACHDDVTCGHPWRGRPLGVRQLGFRVRDVIAAAGVTGAKAGPHTLRHTYATMYLRSGGNLHRLQRLLGHSSLRETQRYMHLSDQDLADGHSRHSPLAAMRRVSA